MENAMPIPTCPNLHHIALTVTDLDASLAWYERIFGLTYRLEEPHPGGTGKLLTDDDWQLVFVLHRHDANKREAFVETQTGLDHVGMRVPSRADLEEWQAHLEEQGVAIASPANRPLTQNPIYVRPYGSVLVFRDPDNIQLEMVSPPNT
jgi:glyoxylase I family protein